MTRPDLLPGRTVRRVTGCGKMYVTVNSHEGEAAEVFARLGKAGGCAAAQCEALGRLATLALRRGASAAEIAGQLRGIACHMPAYGDEAAASCGDAVGQALEEGKR